MYDTLIERLSNWDVDLSKLRGRGYDGDGNMAGKLNGLQAGILRDHPTAVYVHCLTHSINLALMSLLDIREVIILLEQ